MVRSGTSFATMRYLSIGSAYCMVELLVLHIWNVPDSNLGLETGYFKVVYGFLQSTEDNARTVP
jgi:hypothetical protein